MKGTGQHRCKKGICTWVLRGALTSLGKVGTVRMYPILIRCVFVSVCGHIRGVRINKNQSISQRVREKIPVPIGRVLNRPWCLANVTLCGNKYGVKIGSWYFPEMKLVARRDGCHKSRLSDSHSHAAGGVTFSADPPAGGSAFTKR